MMRLIITRHARQVQCALESDPAVLAFGPSIAEAVTNWIAAHGASHGLEIVVSAGEGVDPNTPDPSKGLLSEDELFAFANERTGRPMTAHERAWCLREIASVEGYNRADYEPSDSKQLARGVLTAWVDFCRDKGVLP